MEDKLKTRTKAQAGVNAPEHNPELDAQIEEKVLEEKVDRAASFIAPIIRATLLTFTILFLLHHHLKL